MGWVTPLPAFWFLNFGQPHFSFFVMALESFTSVEELSELVRNGFTDSRISRLFQEQNPDVRGFSARSIWRIRQRWDIHRTTRISDDELNRMIEVALDEVIPLGILLFLIGVYLLFLIRLAIIMALQR